MAPHDPRRAVEAVWRIESARLVAGLTRLLHDFGLAEECAQEALVAALEQWPTTGVPDNPGAWLTTTAKRRAIDQIRRQQRHADKLALIGRQQPAATEPDLATTVVDAGDGIGDDLLRLVFMACHPVLPTHARVALTLRVLGGLTTAEIARAFLVAEPTVSQRIVRAKRTLAENSIRFEVPGPAERPDRLASVLEVIYLIFNEGYTATAGEDWMRPALAEEALRLGRVLAELTPAEPEVHGLLALLELHASRMRSRTGPSGEPVLLLDQDRARWDQLLIRRGLAALDRARMLCRPPGQQSGQQPGPYLLQAEIAACHARAGTAGDTDWVEIAQRYGELAEVAPSPVVELNRAVALAMAYGPEVGLQLVSQLAAEPALQRYHLLPSVRGDLLMRLHRWAEAREEWERAASLTGNKRERRLLRERAAQCEAMSRDVAGTRTEQPHDRPDRLTREREERDLGRALLRKGPYDEV